MRSCGWLLAVPQATIGIMNYEWRRADPTAFREADDSRDAIPLEMEIMGEHPTRQLHYGRTCTER